MRGKKGERLIPNNYLSLSLSLKNTHTQANSLSSLAYSQLYFSLLLKNTQILYLSFSLFIIFLSLPLSIFLLYFQYISTFSSLSIYHPKSPLLFSKTLTPEKTQLESEKMSSEKNLGGSMNRLAAALQSFRREGGRFKDLFI